MMVVTLNYPRSADAKFDMDYYLNSHMKMVIDKAGSAMRRVTVEQGQGDNAPFATVRFEVDSMEAFGAAMAPHNAEFQADIANYTDAKPTMHVAELAINHQGRA